MEKKLQKTSLVNYNLLIVQDYIYIYIYIHPNYNNPPSKFREKFWVEINNNSSGTHNINSQVRFKTTIAKSSLCYYGDTYALLKETVIIT